MHLQGRVHIKVSEGTHDDADAAAIDADDRADDVDDRADDVDDDVDDRADDDADGAYTGAVDAANAVADDDQGGFVIKASGDGLNDDDI